MIQLDENHWVASADEAKAIRPMWIPDPRPYNDPNRRNAILDPDRCSVLVGGDWIIIERGPQAIAKLLEDSKP